jgi:Ca2+-binding RTX toxin-like protein
VTVNFGGSCCPPDLERVIGTEGNDLLTGGNHRQCLVGAAGDDRLVGGNQGDVLLCGPGDDVCEGNNQSDLIRGGTGDDFIVGGNGAEARTQGLWGGPGDDTILGGNGKDLIRGGAGADRMYGGAGDDVFVIAAACEAQRGEVIDGGLGFDRIESPLTEAQLLARGVTIVGVEQFIVVPTLEDAECVDP